MLLKARRAPSLLHIMNACQAFEYHAVWIELGRYAFIARLHELYHLRLIDSEFTGAMRRVVY